MNANNRFTLNVLRVSSNLINPVLQQIYQVNINSESLKMFISVIKRP